MTSPAKLHDPLFHYETHFPERLSRLHLGDEFGHAGSFKKKSKTRQRTGVRYKTQPVTFDEIKEVDEESVPATAEEKEKGGSGDVSKVKTGLAGLGLMGQFQAFSRSMDGLLPRIPEQVMIHPLTAPPRRHHFERPPSIPSIPERVETGGRSPGVTPSPNPATSPGANPFFPRVTATPVSSSPSTTSSSSACTGASVFLPAVSSTSASSLPSSSSAGGQDRLGMDSSSSRSSTASTTVTTGNTLTVQAEGGGLPPSPIPSPTVGSRRQKVTAKAKKRQKAAEEHSANKET